MSQQTITIWIASINNRNGLSSEAHTSEAGAWNQVVPLFAETQEEKKEAAEFIATGDFVGLSNFLSVLGASLLDAVAIKKQELTVDVVEPTDVGVSESENDFGVTVTVDVTADYPGEAPRACIESLGITQEVARTLTFHVSSLESGGTWEMDADGKLLQ